MRSLGRSATALALVIGGAVAPLVPATSASAAGCTAVNTVYLYGRVGYMWKCSNGYHGQIANASGGDDVQLRYRSGGAWYTYSTAYVASGSTSANTAALTGGDLVACIHAKDRPGSVACAYN